ncbi:hypothetical protein [Streptomyces sp. Ac-502]|uniref:hypothetical protein n=1 Tax=Streptomyces sp. Ac-502 TaxID=3342801 RepID=UPI003862B228
MSRHAKPVSPVAVASAAPASGKELKVLGCGRTKTEWVPDKLHSGAFTVGTVHDGKLRITGKDPSVCQRDTGGPALRERNGRIELAGVSGRSWQSGRFGLEETRKDAVESRCDDTNRWIRQVRSLPKCYLTAADDFDGDGRAVIEEGDVSKYAQSFDCTSPPEGR